MQVTRRIFGMFLAGLAAFSRPGRAGDIPAPGQAKVDNPPDPKKKGIADDAPPVGDVEVTPDMKVTISGRSGETELFIGKSKDFTLAIQDHKGRKRKDAASFSVDNISKLPTGELSFKTTPLSDNRSDSQVVLELKEVHCPGLTGDSLNAYYQLIDANFKAGVISAGLMLKVEKGPSVWFDSVYLLDITSSSLSKNGGKWKDVRIVAKTALRVD